MEGSHRPDWDQQDRPWRPVLKPGSALMFNARLRTITPDTSGDVIFARGYDLTNIRFT